MGDKESTFSEKNESIITPRENLIAIALSFLSNPKIQGSPMSQKIAFLKSKGLTEEEINIALHRVQEGNGTLLNNENNAILVPKQNPFWFPMGRFTTSFIFISLALYGIHYIYKMYVEPWLFGNMSTINRLTLIDKQLVDINSHLSQLKLNVLNLEQKIEFQKQALDQISTKEAEDFLARPLVLNDIKCEINSLKSILLSRHQFPAAPKLSPTIPSWQLDESKEKSSECTLENAFPEASPEHCLEADSQENPPVINDNSTTKNQNEMTLPEEQQSEDELDEMTDSNNEINLNGQADYVSETEH